MKPRRFVRATTFSISCSRGTVKLACYSPPGVLASRAGRPPHWVGRQNPHPPHCVGRREPLLTSLISFGAGMLATSGGGPGDAPAALSARPRSLRSIPHRVSNGDTFEYLRLPSVEELLLQRAGQAACWQARNRRKGIRPQPGLTRPVSASTPSHTTHTPSAEAPI